MEITDEMVERGARAIAKMQSRGLDLYAAMTDKSREEFCKYARACLTAALTPSAGEKE